MAWLYLRNNDPSDRYTQIKIVRDDASTMTLTMGESYDLSSTELARARMYADIVSSVALPSDPGSPGTTSGTGSIVITEKGADAIDPTSKANGTIWIEVT